MFEINGIKQIWWHSEREDVPSGERAQMFFPGDTVKHIQRDESTVYVSMLDGTFEITMKNDSKAELMFESIAEQIGR